MKNPRQGNKFGKKPFNKSEKSNSEGKNAERSYSKRSPEKSSNKSDKNQDSDLFFRGEKRGEEKPRGSRKSDQRSGGEKSFDSKKSSSERGFKRKEEGDRDWKKRADSSSSSRRRDDKPSSDSEFKRKDEGYRAWKKRDDSGSSSRRRDDKPSSDREFKRKDEGDRDWKKRDDIGSSSRRRDDKPSSDREYKRKDEGDKDWKKRDDSGSPARRRDDKPSSERGFKRKDEGDKDWKKRADSSSSYRRRDDKPSSERGFKRKDEGDKDWKKRADSGSSSTRRDDKPSSDREFKRKDEGERDWKKRDDSGSSSRRRDHKSDFRSEKPYNKYPAKPFDRDSKKEEEGDDKNLQNKGYSKKKVLAYKKKHEGDGLIRLNKYVANSGICSRREADTHISAGLVSVNGKTITEMGYKVGPEDAVRYNGELLKREKPVYLLLNKPKDYITTLDDPENRKTVMELIKHACRERVYPVGRLDRNTTGLLLFTNDGEMAKKLTHPKHGVKKIYHVETNEPVKKTDINKILEGIDLEDGFVKADEVSYVGEGNNKNEVGIVLHSGQNRVVRRIFESLGYEVVKLDRVYFGGLTKKDLPRGKWRLLNTKEINMLKMI
jgi:23S rRNA pseudouridine2605 synthase